MKGVFDTKAGSGYDDEITRRYHFPSQYRRTAESMIDDWVVYREPQRNNGRRAYIAAARVERIEPDHTRAGHYYAGVKDYLNFDHPVPFVSDGRYLEAPLRQITDSRRVGLYLRGKSVRQLSEEDFGAIVRLGLRETLARENWRMLNLDPQDLDIETNRLMEAPPETQERRIEQILLNRKIRDAAFRQQVCDAYENQCAVTGLRIINGGGKAEVQAAHIWAVKDGGPDVVQNGIALSSTVHWLFDRHLISLTDDYRLLVAHNRVPSELRSLFVHQLDQILLPKDRRSWPHPTFLAKHRESFTI